VAAQDLPGKIRGYKVYKTNVNILTSTDKAAGKRGEDAARLKAQEDARKAETERLRKQAENLRHGQDRH
jgi:hypothetical protein